MGPVDPSNPNFPLIVQAMTGKPPGGGGQKPGGRAGCTAVVLVLVAVLVVGLAIVLVLARR